MDKRELQVEVAHERELQVEVADEREFEVEFLGSLEGLTFHGPLGIRTDPAFNSRRGC